MAKNENTENFPVASLLLAPQVRDQVLEFYRFARKADDIADAPSLSSEEKLSQLKGMETDNPFLQDLLQAFRQDAVQNRYESWQGLIDYCHYSANPVGRFLLDAHDEDKGQQQSDALCTVLQVLNHLQDCQKDYLEMDRIYLPSDYLPEGQTYETLLANDHTGPELRAILDRCLQQVQEMLNVAMELPSLIKNKRLRYQAKVTLLCAIALLGKLKRQDPLATRVELTKFDKFLLAYKGLYPL